MNFSTPSKKLVTGATIVLLLITNLFSAFSQCPVTAFANPTTIYCGDTAILGALANGCKPLNNNFNGGVIGAWQASPGGVVTNGTGTYSCAGPPPEGSYYLWMGATVAAPRGVTTNNYDLTQCGATSGTICFDLKYSTQGGPDPCEGIDLPAEGINVQYSTAGPGGPWITLQYYNPNGGYDPTLTAWNRYCLVIPPGAFTTSTCFRWYQSQSSGAGFDTWGLDNMVITLNSPGYTYDWAHDLQAPSASAYTPPVAPTTTTTYTVTYTNGVGPCTSTVTVNVLIPTVSVTATPSTICMGGSSQLIANSSLVYTPPNSCGVNANANCPPNSVGDEKKVGNGTHTYAYNTGYAPGNLFGGFGDAYNTTHILYTAADLSAAGLVAGAINSLAFDIQRCEGGGGVIGSVTYPEIKIDMGCTAGTAMVNFANPTATFANVYAPKSKTLSAGLQYFFFDQSYNWDGVSNILIRVCWRVAAGASSSGIAGYAFPYNSTASVGYNCLFQSGSNFEAGQCTTAGSTALYNRRPNTIFGFCKPRPITLSYTWTPTTGLNNANIYNPVATPGSTTTYSVTVQQVGAPVSCGATANTTVTVVTSNMTAVNGSRCGTGTVNISTTGCTGTVNWYTAATGGASIGTGTPFTTPSIAATTTYYAECTASGCVFPRIPVIATVNPIPSSTFTTSPATVCAGVNTTITYTGAVIAGQTYAWNFAGGTVVSGSGAGPYQVNWPNPAGGSYNVTLTVTAAGCSSVLTTQTVTVTPGPDLTITPASPSYCAPGSVNLTGTVVLNPPTYPTNGTNTTDVAIPNNGVGGAGWTGTAAGSAVSDIVIPVLPAGTTLTSICLNIDHQKASEVIVYLVNPCGGIIKLFGGIGGAGTTGFNTTCFTPGAANVIGTSGPNATPYNSTYLPQGGSWGTFLSSCPNVNGTWELRVGDAAAGFPAKTGTLTNWSIDFSSPNSVVSYLWSPSTNLTSTNTASTTASPAATTTYSLTVVDAVGCPATKPVTVSVSNPSVATFSYTGTPYCQNAANPSPTFSGGGVAGTFSSTAGLSINAGTGVINLAASTPGTYTVTNTVAGAGACPAATATSTITITPLPVATFSYTGSPYCQNVANPSPTFSGGGVAGTFSSTAGLVFVSTSTGQVNLSASTPGTYTVTNTIAAAGGCPVVTATSSITITAPNVATFSYTGSPYCQNAANPSPTFSGGGVAGTFSSTAGLSINAATGAVNLSASTAGTYTVTNTIAATGGCPVITATANITITPLPIATFSYTGSPYCQNAANPSPTFGGGGTAGTFTSSAGLSINASTGAVNLAASTPGTYTVTNTFAAAGGCPAVTATSNVTITPVPVATFSYTGSPYCQNAANPSPTFSGGGVAGTFSSTAGLVFVSTSTGQVNLSASTAGTYTVTNTIAAAGGCPAVTATSNITITVPKVATFSYTGSPYCQDAANPSPTFSGGGIAGTFSSTAGLVFVSTSTGQVNLSASTAGTYTVTNTIAPSGGCPAATATATITITVPKIATFSYIASPYCQNATNPSPTFSGGGVAGIFSSTAGLVFVSTATGQINLSASTAGTYTVTNTIAASGGCPAVTATASITITPLPIATFSYTGTPYCQNAANPSPTFSGGGIAGTFSSTAGLVFVSTSTGQVNLSASTSGTYTVTNTIAAASGCPAVTATSTITITPASVATFSYTGSPYCKNAANPSPTFSGGGVAGTFSSTAGLVFVSAATGQVNLSASTAGTYMVTNTIVASGGCPAVTATASITITPLPVATFSYTGTPYCQNAANPSPTFSGGGIAGTFTSTAGLSINASTGVVNLSASTAGTYTVTNTIAAASGCPAVTATATITITPLQNAGFNYSTGTFCQTGANPTPTITGAPGGTFTSSPAGLVFVSTSTGKINLASTPLNTYSITYTTAGPCANSSSVSVTISNAPSAAFSFTGSPYCQNGTNPFPTFSGGGTAGTFTSTAGLVFVNAGTGQVDLAASTPGTYTVTNTIAASGGCAAASAASNITIGAAQVATFSYSASPYCQNAANPSPTFSGGGTAGTFSSTAGLSINAATGVVNLAASTAGTYTVTNTIAASGACPAVTATATITITTLPVATFNYSGTPFCQNSADPSPTFSGGGTAGTFTSTAGLIINASTGVVNLAASTTGTYTVTNTIAAANGCAAVTATASITITPVPVATFSYTASPYCQNAANPSPTFSGGGTAGTFTSTGGLTINAATGVVNLAASTAGTYTVTNTIAAAGGCAAVSATASITITPLPIATFSYSASPYCQSAANPSPTFSGGGVAGTFSSTAGLVFVSASTGQINLSASTPGTYTVTNTIASSGGCPAVTATSNVTITPVPVATFSYIASPYCQSAANPSPTFSGGGSAGTFSSTAGLVFVSTGTGQVNLSASTPGTYIITNTIAASGGCPAVAATASITINSAPTATFSYVASPYCQNAANPSPTFSGSGIAGTFSSTAGLIINASNGTVNLSASTAGTYTVSNTIPAAGGCPASTATSTITIAPVQNAGFNYSSSTFCQTGTNPVPSITGTAGGTFTSSPAGLTFVSTSTGEINLASSPLNTYSITYTTPGPCPSASTVTISISNAPVATFAYSGSPYCQNATDPSPTFSGGGTAGTFTSTAGLSINAGSGTVNLAASTPGTYTVTNTIAASGGCAAATATSSITINPVQNSGFNYSSPTFCQTGANPTPVITGVAGGTFSSSPAGLVFVSTSTGEINLIGSSLNTYTITYTTPGPCPSSSTASVTVSNPTLATMNYNGPYCQDAANPSPNFAAGASAGTFTSSPAGLIFVSTSTGEVDLAASTPGTYTVTNTIPGSGGCPPSIDTAGITITFPPVATFTYNGSPYCQTAANPLPTFSGGGIAGTFTPSSPSLVFVSTSTGEIDLLASVPGTYTVTNTIPASGGCSAITATANITINPLQDASFNYSTSTFCQSGSNPIPTITGVAGGTFTSSPAGLVFTNATTGEINLASSALNSYTITYNTPGPCPNLSTATVTITNAPEATFSYTGTPYCQNATNPFPTFTGAGTAGTFSSTAGLVFVSTSTGEVDLAASTPGTYNVVNTIPASGGCAAANANASITISPLQNAGFNYSSNTFCQSGTNPTPTITGVAGGAFTSSPAGLVFVNANTGEIDLTSSTLNTYTITYTTPGPCVNSSTTTVTITTSPIATFSYTGTPYCQNASAPSPVFSGGGSAGTFTSAAGLSINSSNGTVDLSASTPGTYTVTNTITATGCPAAIATATITITAPQTTVFSYTASPYCQDATNPSAVLSGSSVAGTFTSTAGLVFLSSSTGQVDLLASTPGTYTVTNTIPASGGCPADFSTANITINPVQDATFNYSGSTFCSSGTNPIPVVTGTPGGTFTASPAGLVFVNTATGEINLVGSTLNTYTVTYTTSGPCAAVSTATVTITNAPSATFDYSASPYCLGGTNPSPTFTGSGSAGTFTSTVGLSINASTGVVDLSTSTAGSYTVTNTIPASGGCPATSATANIVINAPQTGAFSYTASPYCLNGTDPSPTISAGSVAGVFSSTAGLSINSIGVVNLASSTPGTYTVTNTIGASGGCPVVTDNASITIDPLQNAGFNYSAGSFCQSASNPTPTVTGVGGGTFSSSPAGLSINSGTGTIDLINSLINTYSVTYTTPGPCANSSTFSVTITTIPTATVAANSQVCAGQTLNLNSTGGGTYSWSGPGGYTSGVQNPSITTVTATNTGTYTVTVDNGGCTDTAQIFVTINSLPIANAGTDATIASGTSVTLAGSGGTTFIWTPATNLSCNNCPNPIASPLQTTEYCMVTSNGSCSSTDCVTINVESTCPEGELEVPNAFSPNNDGNNDQFCLQGWNGCISNFMIYIYDRWGEKVFDSTNPNFCWDGVFRGQTLDPAVFVYFIRANNAKGDLIEKNGNISLIR